MLTPDVNRVAATGSAHIAITKYELGATARRIAADNDSRRSIRFSNEGSTTVWFGASANMYPGASALNFGSLLSGSNTEVEHYSGPIYAWAGGGVSLAPIYLGVAEMG